MSTTEATTPVTGGQDSLEECLASILSSPKFTVADYLNTALGDQEETDYSNTDSLKKQNELQRSMAELALQLQMQTQSCHEDIGRIGAELQAVLPRCAADVSRLSVGMQGLQMDASTLLQQSTVALNNNNNNTIDVSHSLETLSTLHALQANLTRTKEILSAAATWDATYKSVATYLSQQNLAEAVHCLAVLEKGERALRGMPNPEERIDAIAKVRSQVSTLLQPQLQHALAVLHTRVSPLQQCVSLYTQLDQMEVLVKEYVKHRPAAIHKLWFDSYRPSVTTDTNTNENDKTQQESEFATWLPGWLDAVLSLVTEERRQCTTIFGAERVSEIVIKVFRECFRPILPSFQSRLNSIYSADPLGSKTGSLQSISTIYESMLRFLSVAYETIVGGWLDMGETTSAIVTVQGPKLYQEVAEIFVQVASPFREYQLNLSKLETKFLGEQMQKLAKDIQQATMSVTGAGTSLEILQNTTDRLQELSTAVFPFAEGAVARFELLNGGFSAGEGMAAIDKLLSGHANELAIAVHKLSAAMNSDEKVLAENVDEPHVLCALCILKVAGSYKRYLRALEDKSRERLCLLLDRVETNAAREQQVQEAAERALVGGKSSFQLSDSMSVVEIDSLLTKSVFADTPEGDFDASVAVLQRLADKEEKSSVLFSAAHDNAKRLATSCHTFVYDICSSVPRLRLSGMSTMASWKESDSAENYASYGTLPQEYITHVGEHMLSLVQALEPFASDKEALSLANEIMEGVRSVAQQPWLDFVAASGASGSASIVQSLMDGHDLIDVVLGGALLDEDDEGSEEEDAESKAVTEFCNAWLDVVGLATTGRLLERIMRIPLLTKKGCEHLNADLGYLVNVFSALGISGHPHPLLGHLAELAVLDESILSERIDSLDRSDKVSAFLYTVEERLATMRTAT